MQQWTRNAARTYKLLNQLQYAASWIHSSLDFQCTNSLQAQGYKTASYKKGELLVVVMKWWLLMCEDAGLLGLRRKTHDGGSRRV